MDNKLLVEINRIRLNLKLEPMQLHEVVGVPKDIVNNVICDLYKYRNMSLHIQVMDTNKYLVFSTQNGETKARFYDWLL